MSNEKGTDIRELMRLLFKSHPWHGVSIGDDAPEIVNTYIEIVPTDTIKYELDKLTGLLKVDRPQRFSNVCPTYYGLVPRTFCGEKVAELFEQRASKKNLVGDGDPLDICVFSEKTISQSNILLKAIPIGGLSMLDGEEADDKIVAVMEGDAAYGDWKDISQCPQAVLDRLKHYFLTYKNPPGSGASRCEITSVYGREEAHRVINASRQDYLARYGDLSSALTSALDEQNI